MKFLLYCNLLLVGWIVGRMKVLLMGNSGLLWLACMYLLFCVGFTRERDTLMRDETLKDGEKLTSTGGVFELGFFSLGNSTNRYVGIWYKNITPQTVVWVANTQSPLKSKAGVIFFTDSGYLKVSDEKNTFLVTETPYADATSAGLLHNGNFVVRRTVDGHDGWDSFWESFDHPSHTLLPGMKLEVDRGSRQSRSLSWRSHEDPAPGEFTLGCSPHGCNQLQVGRGNIEVAYWRGRIEELGSRDSYSIFYNTNPNEVQLLRPKLINPSVLLRYVLDPSGEIKQWMWSNKMHEWQLLWHAPTDVCNVSCGAFGVCNLQADPICSCMHGFEPASIDEWKRGDWSKGCRMKKRSQCQNKSAINQGRDIFLTMADMRLPKYVQSLEVGSSSECQFSCLNDCSCSAYVYGLKCYKWIGELFNLQQLPTISSNTTYGEILNVRTVPTELIFEKGRKRPLPTPVLVVISSGIFLLGFVIRGCVSVVKIKHKEEKELKRRARLLDLGANAGARNNFCLGNGLRERMQEASELQLFSFASVVAATNNFWHANMLGQGGFGPVYKGKFHDGREIAVKRLSKSSRQGLEEFKNEIMLIAQLQHMNLVRLLGCCIEKEEMMLLYEYMPNKSLDFYIFDQTKKRILDWEKRRHIINGIAQGLLYLHQYSRLKVIHRDLKASNILLDGEMNAKISDFGLARMFLGNELQANTNRVVGTYGYMSPEYAMEGHFSIKSDVFSFGVLLLEIMSSKKNTEFHFFDRPQNLLGYAWELWKMGWGAELIDNLLISSSSKQEQMRYIHVGLLCVQENALERPTMSEVIYLLANDSGPIPSPKQPAYSFGRRTLVAEQPRNSPPLPSINEVTVSTLRGR